MNVTLISLKRSLGLAFPIIVLAAVACGSAATTASDSGSPAGTTAPAASSESVPAQGSPAQTSLEESIADVSTPSSESSSPSVESLPMADSGPASENIEIDADDIVAAFETVIGSIHDNTLDSVVQVSVAQRVSSQEQSNPFGFPSPFGPPPQEDELPPQDFFFRNGEGSGFVWSKEGHIVTNHHVIADADRVTVIFPNGTEASAEVLGEDPDSDLAVLKIDLPPDQLTPVQLGDSNKVKVGQLAVAIGNPFGQEFTTTSGIVSAVGRTIRSGNTQFSVPKVIQTDAPINPGNSGGPLLDRHGRVIGINTQIVSRSGASAGVGFAVPIDTARQIIPELIEHGRFEYAWLGISGVSLRPEVAELMDVPEDTRGAQIIQLADDGPARDAGLRGSDEIHRTDEGNIPYGGDVIIAVDGAPINSMDELIVYLIENTRPGDTVTMDVIRDGGDSAQIRVTLGTRPGQ